MCSNAFISYPWRLMVFSLVDKFQVLLGRLLLMFALSLVIYHHLHGCIISTPKTKLQLFKDNNFKLIPSLSQTFQASSRGNSISSNPPYEVGCFGAARRPQRQGQPEHHRGVLAPLRRGNKGPTDPEEARRGRASSRPFRLAPWPHGQETHGIYLWLIHG